VLVAASWWCMRAQPVLPGPFRVSNGGQLAAEAGGVRGECGVGAAAAGLGGESGGSGAAAGREGGGAAVVEA